MDGTERQYAHESPLQLATSGFGGCGDVSYSCQDYLKQQYIVEAERSQLPPVTVPGPHWIHYQQIYQTHVQYLAETQVAVSQREMACNQPGIVSGFRPSGSFLGLNLPEVESAAAASEELAYPTSQSEVLSSNYSSANAEYQIRIQNQQPNASLSRFKHSQGLSGKPTSSESKLKSMSADQARRLRIDSRLNDLQKLLPDQQAKKGGKASLLDDVIDYVKYLQLQVKDLSQSRLGGQICNPLVFLEGYGHYLIDEDINEPLEEMIGKFLEVNPSAATQLLESRGLFIRPTAMADGLQQAL